MSQILNALRKAENERQLGKTPNVSDINYSSFTPAEKGKSKKKYINIIVAFFIVSVFIAGLVLTNHKNIINYIEKNKKLASIVGVTKNIDTTGIDNIKVIKKNINTSENLTESPSNVKGLVSLSGENEKIPNKLLVNIPKESPQKKEKIPKKKINTKVKVKKKTTEKKVIVKNNNQPKKDIIKESNEPEVIHSRKNNAVSAWKKKLQISAIVYDKDIKKRFVLIKKYKLYQGEAISGTDYIVSQIFEKSIVVRDGKGVETLIKVY